jgi:hypothetical protein
MNIEFSILKKVNDLHQVITKNSNFPIDVTKQNTALHIGKDDEYRDGSLIFSESNTLIDFETKFSHDPKSHINFRGKSNGSFRYEQEKSKNSPCKLKRNYFIFITNSKMSEENKEEIVDTMSLFVNRERWNDTFSPLFEFLKNN